MAGRIGLARTAQRNGMTNLAVSWAHQQEFSRDSRLTTNLNYVTNTTLQRQNTFDPYSVLATISSAATYQQKVGPFSLNVGGTMKQYPGREQRDLTAPFSLSTGPLKLAEWLTWTPAFGYSGNWTLKMDQPGTSAFVYTTSPTGTRDSVALDRSS